uniref:BED-type domain-containing protein n=1 Tax=Ditylenchus dipsaci TaxID=166011 RepID=A0A915EMG5_9BILA
MYTNSPQNGERKAPEYEFHSPLPNMSQPMLSIPLLPHQSASSSCSSGLRGRPYAKKTPSKVWLAYTRSEQGPICNYCGSIRKRKDSSTKTLWDHLDRKHYEVAMVLRRESISKCIQARSHRLIR